MLVVRNLRRDVPAADGGVRTVFEEISFELAPGETLFITGRSGCGKSLLLRAVVGLDAAQAGGCSIGGSWSRELGLPLWRTRVAYVSQARWAFPGSPSDTFAAFKEFKSQKGRTHALSLDSESLGLEPAALLQPWATLSGGQAQRAAIAVVLALRPEVLALDEPTSALDTETSVLVERALLASGCALLWVSHDPNQPSRVGGRVLRLGESPAPGSSFASLPAS